MITDGQIDVFVGILKLKQVSCKEFKSCAFCPFAIEETDTKEYGCRLTEAFKLLTDCTVSDEYNFRSSNYERLPVL